MTFNKFLQNSATTLTLSAILLASTLTPKVAAQQPAMPPIVDNITFFGGGIASSMSLVYGTKNNDTLQGDATANMIFGLEGDDTVRGGKAGDTLMGNQGRDSLYGDDGNDIIFGGKGMDYLYGGKGDDTIYTDKDGGLVWAGQGNDKIYAVPVYDTTDPVYPISYVNGNEGTDEIFVELADPATQNPMVLIHNEGNEMDNLTIDSRYNIIRACTISDKGTDWQLYQYTTPTNGQNVFVWVLGKINPIQKATVNYRTYPNYQAANAQVVSTATKEALSLANSNLIPEFIKNGNIEVSAASNCVFK